MIGAKSIPPPSKIEGLQAITKLRPISGCRYFVYTYALNQDIIDANGKVDDFRGMFFILGSFDSKKEAENHIEELIVKTKHHEFYISEYAKPIRISTVIDSSDVSRVYVDNLNKIKKMESEQYQRDKELYERQMKIENDIVQEEKDEYDEDHIDYFKRQCYLAIKNRTKYESLKEEMEKSYSNYKKNIREHYTKHPEHEEQWLSYLNSRLIEREELSLYDEIESGYKKYRDDLLGIDK